MIKGEDGRGGGLRVGFGEGRKNERNWKRKKERKRKRKLKSRTAVGKRSHSYLCSPLGVLGWVKLG